MANTPENNMDKPLKACAEQRRAEAGPAAQMPESTRRVLQAEVARTFPKQKAVEPHGWLRLFSGFWPRLAIGTGLVAVLTLATLVSLDSEKQVHGRFELAKNTDSDQLRLPARVAPASAPEAKSRNTELSDAASKSEKLDQLAVNDLSERRLDLAFKGAGPAVEAKQDAGGAQPAPQNTEVLLRVEASAAASAPRAGTSLAAGTDKQLSLTSDREAKKPTEPPPGIVSGIAARNDPKPTLKDERASIAAASANKRLEVEDRPEALAEGKTLRDRAASSGANTPPRPDTVLVARAQDARARSISNSTGLFYFQGQQARGRAEKESNAQRLQFSQVDTRARFRLNRNSPPLPNVLKSFQIQRQGSNIMVIDADGSVYEGTVQILPQGPAGPSAVVAVSEESVRAVAPIQRRVQAPREKLQDQSSPASIAAESPAGDNFYFSAVGTNRSLNQKVVFTGNYLPLQIERIEGKAAVGGKSYFPIEALRVEPQP